LSSSSILIEVAMAAIALLRSITSRYYTYQRSECR
jgi:hypothetical protein